MNRREQSGVTLIELMTVVSIVGILLGIGVPSLTTFIVKNRLVTSGNDLISALSYARTEAIKRGKPVSLCKRRVGESTCDLSGRDWAGGWLVFVDSDPLRPTPSEILRVYEALPRGYSLSFSAPRSASFTFMASGQPISNFAGGTFRLCGSDGQGRNLVINRAGRVRSHSAPCV